MGNKIQFVEKILTFFVCIFIENRWILSSPDVRKSILYVWSIVIWLSMVYEYLNKFCKQCPVISMCKWSKKCAWLLFKYTDNILSLTLHFCDFSYTVTDLTWYRFEQLIYNRYTSRVKLMYICVGKFIHYNVYIWTNFFILESSLHKIRQTDKQECVASSTVYVSG